MRKIFLLLVILFAFMSAGTIEAASRFRDFPARGVCTGDYVRDREGPDTESDIVGRLFTGDRVTVLSQTSVDGEIWYEIEDPENDEMSVWVYGRYIRPVN